MGEKLHGVGWMKRAVGQRDAGEDRLPTRVRQKTEASRRQSRLQRNCHPQRPFPRASLRRLETPLPGRSTRSASRPKLIGQRRCRGWLCRLRCAGRPRKRRSKRR